ncbi:MDR family MFS transporter [Actinomadura terrae]|uniref:MDR family MFS transporter n=1 Tax=Actinomadura terrae TaxID=604353 RepID=UPI001FA78632|nr:MDR family MFS transporter [Actinomadura terrae]
MPTATRAPDAARSGDRLDAALLKTSFVLVLGPILAMLDTTIVTVGLDAVAREFGSPVGTLQWVSAGYLLAISMVMPLAGWASDRFGAKTMWLTSVALFTAGSALCGLAWSAGSLIAFRVLQGIGGGLIQPIGQSIVVRAAGPARLGRVFGITVLPLTFAPVLGPVIGGLVVGRLDWRWMFLVNVPVGLLTLVLAKRYVPSDAARERGKGGRLDVLGLALLSPGLAAIVYGFSELGDAGGPSRVVVSLAAGTCLLVGYVVHALRRRGNALIDLRLFARRGFAVATANSFLQGAALYSSMLLLPLYYQRVEHASALEAGLLLAPQALGTAIATFFASRLSDRMAPRPLILTGIVLTLAGTLAFTQLGAGPPGWLLVASLVLRGAGLGVVMAPGMATIYASVRPDETARAAGAVNTVNRVGGSLGTAVLAVVLQHSLDHHADGAAAYGATFWWAVGLSAVTLVPAFLYPARRVSR